MAAVADVSVPIIGQQIAIEGYSISVSARCQCESGGSFVPLTVTCASTTIAPPNSCPKCGLGYAIQGIQMDAKGRLVFAIGVLSTSEASH